MTGGPIRGLLLDVDDTLVDTRGAFRHALVRVGRDYLRDGIDPEELVQFWRADRSGWYRAHTRGELTHREQRQRRANELHAEFGGDLMDDDAYDVWDEGFERYFREGWRAFDDAVPFLDALVEAGIPYGAVTNAASAYQELKLAACGLERVEVFVGVDTFGVGKPDARVFVEGSRRLGLEPGEVAYVGDEPDIDAGAAAAAGLAGVWLDRPGARRGTHEESAPSAAGVMRVSCLDEVLAALR
ncbi:HAD family hydrolase [Demequina aestuarii]|uniref:HAD family hydrolase n=1 Tax=Demequina aestuarii TaxID=327095 RepID=UPI000781E2C9|nr:HAD family hydrolase [Demequina aestuarii]